MKAIKIASGFAVTALAAAVSMQANAAAHGMAAETTVETSGEINVQSVFDLDANTQHNSIKDETDGDQDAFELTLKTTVTHGPFSGAIVIEEVEDAVGAGPLTDATTVRLDDLMVVEGPISFGQIDSVVATDDLLDVVTDEENEGMSYDVEAAFRYTTGPVMIQVEGDGGKAAGATTDFGIGANLTQDIGMGTVYADVQMSMIENVAGDGMDANDTFMGVGAELNPSDSLKITAAFQSKGDSAYGVRADFDAGAMSVYASYGEPSADAVADNDVILAGASMTVDMLKFSGEYKSVGGADTVEVDADYTNGAISANAGYTMALDSADETAEIDLSATYTSESGVKYKGAYDNDTDAAGASAKNAVTLSAAYSF